MTTENNFLAETKKDKTYGTESCSKKIQKGTNICLPYVKNYDKIPTNWDFRVRKGYVPKLLKNLWNTLAVLYIFGYV